MPKTSPETIIREYLQKHYGPYGLTNVIVQNFPNAMAHSVQLSFFGPGAGLHSNFTVTQMMIKQYSTAQLGKLLDEMISQCVKSLKENYPQQWAHERQVWLDKHTIKPTTWDAPPAEAQFTPEGWAGFLKEPVKYIDVNQMNAKPGQIVGGSQDWWGGLAGLSGKPVTAPQPWGKKVPQTLYEMYGMNADGTPKAQPAQPVAQQPDPDNPASDPKVAAAIKAIAQAKYEQAKQLALWGVSGGSTPDESNSVAPSFKGLLGLK